jgi:predicted transcriptional regulator
MELRETMKKRREELRISQLDLAEMAGISLASVKDIERGKANPTLSTVQKILMVLGMEIEYHIRKTSNNL